MTDLCGRRNSESHATCGRSFCLITKDFFGGGGRGEGGGGENEKFLSYSAHFCHGVQKAIFFFLTSVAKEEKKSFVERRVSCWHRMSATTSLFRSACGNNPPPPSLSHAPLTQNTPTLPSHPPSSIDRQSRFTLIISALQQSPPLPLEGVAPKIHSKKRGENHVEVFNHPSILHPLYLHARYNERSTAVSLRQTWLEGDE